MSKGLIIGIIVFVILLGVGGFLLWYFLAGPGKTKDTNNNNTNNDFENIEPVGATGPNTTDLTNLTQGARLFLNKNKTCPSGTRTGPWVPPDGEVPNINPFIPDNNANGVNLCQGVPNKTHFYMVNYVSCPAGSERLGWIKNTAIKSVNGVPKLRPNGTNPETFGLTVCEAPPGYQIPLKDQNNVFLLGNNVSCPNGSVKIGWYDTTLLVRDSSTEFDSFGFTMCRVR